MGETVAFLGLGVMGYPMAGHLKRAGYDVTVYNRTAATAARWVEEYGGKSAATPREAAQGASFVFMCVGNDDDVRAVALGEQGALEGLASGSVLVDHTTASAEVARELGGLAGERGIGFLDAPISGGQAGAENGVLTVMCGRSRGRLRTLAAGDRSLRTASQTARPCRLGPTHEDGQPDLHCWPGSGFE